MVMFGNTHEMPWTTNKVAIGLSDPQLTDFKSKSGKALVAFNAAEAARQASKAATDAYYAAVANLRTSAADCVRTIQNKAKSTNDPTIYALAEISPPDPRSQTGQPPAQPTDIRAELNSDGSITMTWKCANPRGVSRVIYFIKRKLTGEADFTLVDTVGEKTFTDTNSPPLSSKPPPRPPSPFSRSNEHWP